MTIGYLSVQNSRWHSVLNLSLLNYQGWIGYQVWQFCAILFSVGILQILFRAYTIAVCYINLGALSIVNTDPLVSLSIPQLEWIQIEEQMANMKLLKKSEKIYSWWPLFCKRVRFSKYWRSIYYVVIFLGFILNLAT